MNLCGEGLLGKRSVRSTALRTQFSRLGQFSLPQKSICEWTKIFDIRESNPGQLDGNELGYHYPNVEWYLSGEGEARTMIYKVEVELAGSNGWCAATTVHLSVSLIHYGRVPILARSCITGYASRGSSSLRCSASLLQLERGFCFYFTARLCGTPH